MLYLFSFPPTLTMMHLCIIQCTCWTPLTRFYLCTLACPATMNTLTTHLRWGEGKLSTVQLPLCAEVKKMKSLQTLHIRGCLPCQLKGLLFSVVAWWGRGRGKSGHGPPSNLPIGLICSSNESINVRYCILGNILNCPQPNVWIRHWLSYVLLRFQWRAEGCADGATTPGIQPAWDIQRPSFVKAIV